MVAEQLKLDLTAATTRRPRLTDVDLKRRGDAARLLIAKGELDPWVGLGLVVWPSGGLAAMSGFRVDVPLELDDAILDAIAERILSRLPERDDRSPWMAVAKAAVYLDWSVDRLYKLTSAGAIPHRKHGNRILFRREELDWFLEGFREGPRTTWKPSAVVSVDFQRGMDKRVAS